MNRSFVQSPLGMQPYGQQQMMKPGKKPSKGVVFIGSAFIIIMGAIIYFVSESWLFSAPFVVLAIIFILMGLLGGKKNQPTGYQSYQGYR